MTITTKLGIAFAAVALLGASSAVAQVPTGPEVKPKLAINFGSDQEEALSSFAMDKDGSFWVSGMQKGLVDKFTYDWFVAKLDAKGKAKWMRVYGGNANEDSLRHIDMGGEGLPRMLALVPDGSGAIVVGRSETGEKAKQPQMLVIFKVKPDGSLAWSKAFRPGWEDKMIQSAHAGALTIVGKRAYVVGTTNGESNALVAVFDTDTGELKSAQGIDVGAGYNDRFFSVVADEKNKALWVGGWTGQGNKGLIGKLTLDDKPVVTWMKKIPNGWASTVPDIALDAEGNAYAASEVHGATTWIEAWKLKPDGSVVWRAKYDTKATADRQNTHAVHVFGDNVVLLGRVSYSGTQTHSDPLLGDSMILVLDKDANKKFEMYHFTGTHKTVLAMERSRGAAMKGKTFFVAGNIWSENGQYKGQWRKPSDYQLTGTITKDTPATEDAPTKLEDQLKFGTKDPAWLTWTDTTKSATATTPEKATGKLRSTDAYIYSFDKLF